MFLLRRIFWKKLLIKSFWTLLACFVLFLILDFIFPFRFHIRYSQVVLDEENRVLGAFLSTDEKWRMKTELSEISEELQKAFIAKEDKYFFYHFGVNPLAVARAIFNNLLSQKRTSGASTITMQVARLLEPKPRTYWNKLVEMIRAMQLEWHYSKKEILQMYLNLVPYGGNIEGVKSASVIYFQKLPQNLSIAEITTLVIIPNRPNSLSLGKDNLYVQKERNKWLLNFAKQSIFSKKEISNALQEPLNVQRHEVPRLAPHWCIRLVQKYPKNENIQTALHLPVQMKVQALAENYAKKLRLLQIENVAVLVVENKTRKIRAYVGSQNFAESQVDGITAIRSPGSTLKPLVYAIAMDLGKLTPKTTILDIPTDWDGYAPDNFDNKFRGKISVETALSLSLNIPAVATLQEISIEHFVKKLKQAGFKTLEKQEKKVGLSMILGGFGTNLEELTNLYVTFANYGQYAPLNFLATDSTIRTDTIISVASTYSFTQVLTLAQRPDLPRSYQNAKNKPIIAWKTGTSYGKRDAWSIGYNQKYTIGVWVGNFSGKGVPELSGSEIATPLLFEIFNALDNATTPLPLAPKEITFRLVCSESGLPPNTFCKNQVIDYYIPLISPSQVCQHEKELYVSADEKFQYLPDCLPETGYKKKFYPVIPTALQVYYEAQKIPYFQTPPLHPNCEQYLQANEKLKPQIISPLADKTYFIPSNEPTELLLKTYTQNDVQKVYWYINDRLLQEAPVKENIFFKPKLGKNTITCVDDKGRSQKISIQVERE
ncbi:penicillin-binding protein 1C [Raineya orbicola]|jgi:penicillin-binding protein 1C|uniref:peptidoglycan glycosyltransferase n=1 Tax=Raineya orbicola TaxID=2016530 RepID=A0A2N3II14_9BACT|nr:penicillin-binding protein 1C [Raineya orbicola]PKQ69944.1 Penicillin-binding protein 1C [Raineya orbicola]